MWFLHALEDADGRWTCQRGRRALDPHVGAHLDLEEALAHLRDFGRALEGTAQIILHFADGSTAKVEEEA